MRPTALALLLVLLAAPASALVPFVPPTADFQWSPAGAPAHVEVTFTSTSIDRDGRIILFRWIADGRDETRAISGSTFTIAFPRRGTYEVVHEVTDATLLTDRIAQAYVVSNTPPVPVIHATTPAFRGVEVVFRGEASDIDGDAVANWTWTFSDGAIAFGRNVTRTFFELGTIDVELAAADTEGGVGNAASVVRILNRPPVVAADFTPQRPRAGEPVTFVAAGFDPDVPGGEVAFEWSFDDGATVTGDSTQRSFPAGDHFAIVRGLDADGGRSSPVTLAFHVDGP